MDNCPFLDSLFRFFIPNPPPFTLFPLPENLRLFFYLFPEKPPAFLFLLTFYLKSPGFSFTFYLKKKPLCPSQAKGPF